MSLDIGVPGGSLLRPGFTVRRDANGLGIGAGMLAGTPVMFGMANDEGGLSINAYPVASGLGFTVYTFKRSGTFINQSGKRILADRLLLGGGASGGGGFQGGGGSAGGFVDDHDILIGDGAHGFKDVTVGVGGAGVPYLHTHGHNGGDSSYGGVTSYGGGYGSSDFGADIYGSGLPAVYYDASDGASGGGGGTQGPLVDGNYSGPPGRAVHGDQGYDGGPGSGTLFYGGWHTAGGGGGAGEAGNMRGQPNGGHGRCCDIAGWGQYWNDPDWYDFEIRIVPWYCGGGGGMERPNLWGYLSGEGGYGGGGDPGGPGISYTGGGAGGNGRTEPGHNGDAVGLPGGSGRVVIRIQTKDEAFIESTNAVITHLSADQLHTDEPGDDGGPI